MKQGGKQNESSMCRLLVTANVPSSLILVTLMMEALSSSETSVLQEPHGVTSQKTPFFIVTAVKTSNLTLSLFVSIPCKNRQFPVVLKRNCNTLIDNSQSSKNLQYVKPIGF
jgi:hypothetical protein